MSQSAHLAHYDDVAHLARLPYFAIGGAPRSGTTWVANLLNGHPGVACLSEGLFWPNLVPPMARFMSDYNKVMASPSTTLPIRGFDQADSTALVRFAALTLLRRNLKGPIDGLRTVGEKTPNNLENTRQLDALFPGVRVIQVIRDGRDVAISAWHRFSAAWHKTYPPDDPTAFDRFLVTYGQGWAKRVRLGAAFAAEHPGRYLELRFEDLVADPDPQIRRLLAFLEVDDGADMVARCREAGAFDRRAGRAPGQEDARAHYRSGLPEQWRDKLTPAQAALFTEQAREVLEEKGYDCRVEPR